MFLTEYNNFKQQNLVCSDNKNIEYRSSVQAATYWCFAWLGLVTGCPISYLLVVQLHIQLPSQSLPTALSPIKIVQYFNEYTTHNN